MADQPAKPISPISLVLQSIGLTRDDLLRHSDQMRQFLTTEDAKSLRAFSAESSDTQQSLASALGMSRARSSSRSNSLAGAPSISHTPPPPSTPVKSEPAETAVPLRHMDSMEMILERKSRLAKRDKRGRKEKERAPSPSPANAGFSLDAFMQSRDLRRAPSIERSDSFDSTMSQQDTDQVKPIPPVTPQPRKYYRDYDNVEPSSTRSRKGTFSPRADSPTPTRPRTRTIPTPDVPGMQATPSINPITPRRNSYYKSPLPSSSPPQSSPFATPSTKRIVNIVSSPGPMGELPDEDEYDNLPYTLPPGPYSAAKPDLSYAALIGQAVLSSPEHRLTLQEIYDWITIVYPHFKRNETTWMNSIRHVLSTTVCFRKVPRDRALGRTLWAIWDCDLDCFKNGGFRKEFCAEMREAAKKALPKKRSAEDSGSGRRSKRAKKNATPTVAEEFKSPPVESSSTFDGSIIPPLVPTSHLLPLFPPRTSTHHQPYYEHCARMPAEVIFPPLPPSSGYHRVASSSTSQHSSSSIPSSSLPPSSAAKNSEPTLTSPIPPSSSMPGLTPNRSSSSPQLPSEDLPQGAVEPRTDARIASTPPLEPGIMLLGKEKVDKGKRKENTTSHSTPPKKPIGLPPMPISPTLERRAKSKKSKVIKEPPAPVVHSAPSLIQPLTPPQRPSTPPRRGGGSTVQLSPVRTPLSHKGLHMSPSASLVHYKSHLDPPPSVTYHPDDGIDPSVFDTENIRTPSRRRVSGHGHAHHKESSTLFPPMTPKKLVFPAPSSSAESPFRTPGARSIFDPHDPSALLDDELARLGAKGAQESPTGLFEGRRGLLYESPNMPSPGKWARWF
ncbi:hypothetical protein BV22DRAFT_1112896 [Leucogyrophana mollusca]|uniref:Uncharacterized protein n=1 Tax=Leucogyrophana mollusca TaxID=85980 RepID=A0ACB8BEP5_9AGAM|nr:hypothetical protein BV22DRAFT_1112896 [Leucogyrophana mollusca]